MEEALIAYLLADGPLSAAVSNRIHFVTRPQGSALPAVVMANVSGVRTYTLRSPANLTESRIQVDCWGLSFGATKMVGRRVIDAMHRLRGTHQGIVFEAAFLDTERDSFDSGSNAQTGTAERVFRTSLDFIIWHKRIDNAGN